MLFNNFVLTNSHLFEHCPGFKDRMDKWWETIEITVQFHFEIPGHEPKRKCKARVYVGSYDVDYALLYLITTTE